MAFFFSILVLLKHLFVPLAPLFALYLLLCHATGPSIYHKLYRVAELVTVAITALTIAFGPFALADMVDPWRQVKQIFNRLFPFGRGLVHAYWAPNVWALYMFADRLLLKVHRICGLHIAAGTKASSALTESSATATSGLVGDYAPAVLPKVGPLLSLSLVLLSMLPALYAVYRRPNPHTLLRGAAYCSLCSFMLGYHVHEKAVMVPQTLLALLSEEDRDADAGLFLQISAAGITGLFPLFTTVPELLVKGAIDLSRKSGNIIELVNESFPVMLQLC